MVNHFQCDVGSVSGHALGSLGEEHDLQSVVLVHFRPALSWNGVSHVACHATVLQVIASVPPKQNVSRQRQDLVQSPSRTPGLREACILDIA